MNKVSTESEDVQSVDQTPEPDEKGKQAKNEKAQAKNEKTEDGSSEGSDEDSDDDSEEDSDYDDGVWWCPDCGEWVNQNECVGCRLHADWLKNLKDKGKVEQIRKHEEAQEERGAGYKCTECETFVDDLWDLCECVKRKEMVKRMIERDEKRKNRKREREEKSMQKRRGVKTVSTRVKGRVYLATYNGPPADQK